MNIEKTIYQWYLVKFWKLFESSFIIWNLFKNKLFQNEKRKKLLDNFMVIIIDRFHQYIFWDGVRNDE
jgi:hypothetical protein